MGNWRGGLNCFFVRRRNSHQGNENQDSRATTKGQNRLGTFSHVLALLHIFHTFSELFLQDFLLELRGLYYCFNSKRRKENKRESKEKDQAILHVSCCTFVLLRENHTKSHEICPRKFKLSSAISN